LGKEFDNLVADDAFAVAFERTANLGVELAYHDGAGEQLALVHDGSRLFGIPFLDEFQSCVDKAERSAFAMAVNGGDGSPESQSACCNCLVVHFEAVFALPAKCKVLESNSVEFACDIGTHVEPADFDVLENERAHSFGIAHIDAVHARTVVGVDFYVLDGALFVGEEADADSAGVPLSGADGHVTDGIAAP
jgi:hypothetical protein